ncbi:MAG TPA: DUF1385 domain-containing protein [Sandaracinaceae bacterium LLY-WYZ-13_1]|nr:DUF1385 domain-containing protein [Sandaracinaceae bacterium LLY-WYZ-13_1]
MSNRDAKGDEAQPYIGGQAVIEGVMMRAPGCVSVAVRKPDGSIAIREAPLTSRVAHSKLWKWPMMRGMATLVESLSLGYRALSFSADQQLSEEERAEVGEASGRGAMVLATLFALGLFVALPQGAAAWTGDLLGLDLGVQTWQFHAVTGAFKLLVFSAYLGVISQMKDVRRVFQYHGAEHKTIFAYEAGLPLTVENVRRQSTLHPRCGTTFLIVVIFVSVVLGSIVTPLLLPDVDGLEAQLLTLAIRIALLPLIAAVSYELQRFSAKHLTEGPLRVFLWPGFLFQKITTREPDDHQIEIAITAMRTAQWREEIGDGADVDEAPLFFPSFEEFLVGLPSLRPAKVKAAA